MVNREMEVALGISPGAAMGKLPDEFFNAEVAAALREHDLQVLGSEQASQFEEKIPIAGEMRTFLSIKVPLRDDAGIPFALCTVSTDITDRQLAEAELQRARDQLE